MSTPTPTRIQRSSPFSKKVRKYGLRRLSRKTRVDVAQLSRFINGKGSIPSTRYARLMKAIDAG